METPTVTGHFQYPDERNWNRGRIYPRELFENALREYEERYVTETEMYQGKL